MERGQTSLNDTKAVISDDGGSAALLAALEERECRERTRRRVGAGVVPAPRPMPNLPEL